MEISNVQGIQLKIALRQGQEMHVSGVQSVVVCENEPGTNIKVSKKRKPGDLDESQLTVNGIPLYDEPNKTRKFEKRPTQGIQIIDIRSPHDIDLVQFVTATDIHAASFGEYNYNEFSISALYADICKLLKTEPMFHSPIDRVRGIFNLAFEHECIFDIMIENERHQMTLYRTA